MSWQRSVEASCESLHCIEMAAEEGSSNWDRLELLVVRHSQQAGGTSALLVAVADAILCVDKRLKLPAWLQTLFVVS